MAAAMLGLDIRLLGRDPMREFLRIAGINIFDVLEETFESPLLKGALALDAVLGTNLGPRSNNSVLDAAASPERRRPAARRWPVAAGRWHGCGERGAAQGGARGHGATVRTGARLRASRSMAIASTAWSSKSGETHRRGHWSSRTRIRRARCSRCSARGISKPDSCIACGISARRAWPRSCIWRSMACPPSRGSTPALAGERLLIAPDLGYIEARVRRGEVRRRARRNRRWRSRFRAFTTARWRPPGKHVLSAIVQYAPFDPRASSDAARAELLDAHARRARALRAGLRRQIVASELLLPADIEREFRITGGHWHHGELRARSVPDAASGAGRGAVRHAGERSLSLRRRLPSGRRRHGLRRRERRAGSARSGAQA